MQSAHVLGALGLVIDHEREPAGSALEEGAGVGGATRSVVDTAGARLAIEDRPSPPCTSPGLHVVGAEVGDEGVSASGANPCVRHGVGEGRHHPADLLAQAEDLLLGQLVGEVGGVAATEQDGEPTVEDTISILRGVRSAYEEHHKLTISDEALKAIVERSGAKNGDLMFFGADNRLLVTPGLHEFAPPF